MSHRTQLILCLIGIGWLFGVTRISAQVLPAPGVQLQDEGATQGRVQTFNFVGAGVTGSKSGTTATVTIPGGTGVTWTVVEIDFGIDAAYVAVATVSDTNVTSTSKIMVLQSGAAATGRQADENEMDGIDCRATPGSGVFTLMCSAEQSVTHGLFKVQYSVN